MGDTNAPPPGPLLGPSGNYQSLQVKDIQAGAITTDGDVSFFGKEPSDQQDGPANQDESGAVTQSSDHDAIVSLTNTLHTYGLTSHAPIFPGRTITFTNNTSDPTLELYVTIGGTGNLLTKINSFTTTGSASAFVYDIPDSIGWSGNFQAWPTGGLPTNQLGANLFELSANDQTKTAGVNNPLRDNWDISTVPPNIPDPQLDCGPRDQCVAASYTKITNTGSGYFPGLELATTNSGSGLLTGITLTTPGTAYPTGATAVTGGSGTGLLINVLTTTTGPPGPIATADILTPGAGYLDGEIVTATGGGDDATFTLTVDTGSAGTGLTVDLLSVAGTGLTYPICSTSWKPSVPGIGGYAIRSFGTGYAEGDKLTVVQDKAFKLVSGGTGYSVASGVATTVAPPGGTGLTVNILAVSSNVITKASIAAAGDSGYSIGDVVTVTGGGADATFEITSVTPGSSGELTIGELSVAHSQAYNVGYIVTPPAPPTNTITYPPLQPSSGGFWPPVVTTCVTVDGNCPQAITWPNDTVLPKSQTGYAQGDYAVSLTDPVVP